MKNSKKILVIDDDKDFGIALKFFFADKDVELHVAHTLSEGMTLLEKEKPELEFGRNQKFLAARILALMFLLVAVLGIFLRPTLRSSERQRGAILLTEGYDKHKADSIITSDPSVHIFTTPDAGVYAGSTVIDVNEAGTIDNLRAILGTGLPSDALQLLPSPGFNFITSERPRGITRIDIPKNIRPHELSTLHGVANVEDGAFIRLVGPSGTEDSVQMTSKSSDFALRFRPRQTGLFLYSIVVKGNSTTQAGNIPIEVKPESKLKILFIQKFPTAETRSLKNYLAEKGHAVALRYQVSKTNFKYEYSNLPPQVPGRLTRELLSSFDLLFLDNYVFEEIGDYERDAITQSIKDGLGAILFVDQLSGKNKSINRLLAIDGSKSPTDTVHIRLQQARSYALPAIPIEITSSPQVQPVLQTKSRILSGYVYSGFGKIGFQLLRETYRISLEGNSDDYAFAWRELIERTARTKHSRFKFVMNETFPYLVNESILVDVLSDGTQPALVADKTFIPVEEDVLLDDVWHSKIWATKPGWHTLGVKGDSSALNYFVSDTSEWKSIRQTRQQNDNYLFSKGAPETAQSMSKTKVINPLSWYLLFLVSAGFLWLAPKL